MTEKIKNVFDLIDTQPELLSAVTILCAIVFEFRGFDDTATVAMFFLAMTLMGYIRKVKAGAFEFQGDNDGND